MISDKEFEEMKSGDREIGFAWISGSETNGANAKSGSGQTVQDMQTQDGAGTASSLTEDLVAVLRKHGLNAGGSSVFDVATGKLTLEQINLIYRHLPVDLSYVDENETVCFYSDTEHRVFPRSKNVIGRNVKNCHPRASVHIVEEIIEKFRSGEQDSAEFWINKPGIFIYILYTAVRDENGKFRGILEMMQDCTHIRSLTDSQTLLTWKKGGEVNGQTVIQEDSTTSHNGDAVDAASFKRGWERIVNPKMATPSEINYHLAPVKGYDEFLKGTATEMEGLKAVDDTTFEVTLSSSMADFLTVCTHSALAPVPQAALDDPESFLVAPIGNGPFKMDGQWVADQYINVVRFDDYYGEKAKLDGINFSIQKDPDTAFREFEGGNIDMAQIPTGRFNETIEKYGKSDDGYTVTPGHQTLTGAELSVYYLAINIEKMPDKNLRHAVSLAIDRQSICDTLFEGTRIPADSVIPTVLDPDGSNAWADCRYDKDAAQKLIDDNGLAGTEVTLSYNSGGGHEDIMSMVQSDLEAVGLKVQQESQEWASYLQKLKGGDFTMGRLGWIADYPTIDNMLYPNFYSTADNNYSKYKDDEVDQGIDDARQIADEEERKAKLREVNQLIGEDMPIVPLMFYAHNWVGSERVESLYLDPQNKVDFATTTLKA